ncbi:adipocyte plasma membrane-associated protein-like [Babylonia areolata]|uniref:adipocyte plasma membrane-associated protein-like n=1 Tax=Babylonia areolata TaxID=304850 RepID=UPI003FD5B2BC
MREERRDAELVAQASHGWNAFFFAFGAAGILLGVILALLPSPIQPVAFSLPPPPALSGPLALNEKLSQAERVFENQVVGPESIVRDGEYIYTGTADGRIVSIYRGEVSNLAILGKGENCGSSGEETKCGRPYGMRLDKEGYLLVADAYLGIFRVNVATGAAVQLLSSQDALAGKVSRFFNDVEEGEGGVLYFSQSSTRWDRQHHKYLILEADMTGRLLSYDPKTEEVRELMDGLAFANGLTLSTERSHVLVAETIKARIMRYYIKGPRQGQSDVFADNLPGWPDNIRRSGRGTYWVGFASVRHAGQFSLLDFAASRPWVRSLLTKMIPQEVMTSLIPKHGLVVELDKDGNILRSLHDPQGHHVPAVSEAMERDGVLHLGSYYLPYMSRVYLKRK